MDQLWKRIEVLCGQTLRTARGKQFQVVSVDSWKAVAVTILVSSTGHERQIHREEIDASYQLGLKGDDLTPTRLRDNGTSDRNPSYVVAILKAIEARKLGG
jgi:hypothetical protein